MVQSFTVFCFGMLKGSQHLSDLGIDGGGGVNVTWNLVAELIKIIFLLIDFC